MANQTPPTPRPSFWSVCGRTSASFLVKLVIVALGVGAYYALNSMEQSKSSFDKVKSAPLVIVDGPQEKSREIIELTVAEVSDFFNGYENKEMSPEAKKDFVKNLKVYVDRVKYQPVQNSDELLGRMNQEILKDEADAKHDSEQQLDLINKQFAARKASLSEKCPLSETTTPPTVGSNYEAKLKPPVAKPCPQKFKTCGDIQSQYSCLNNNYEAQKARFTTADSDVEKKRELQVKAVYEHVRPKLIDRVNEEKRKRQVTSFAYLFPNAVLDESNGIHVIFNIFWLTCMVILVFGVLFVILLLLRPFPPFSGGTEALSEQAKAFLTRRSATPELAKTVVATTAALGIGTAVAVASGMNMPSTQQRPSVEPMQVSYSAGVSSDRSGQPSRPQPPPIINVTTPPTTSIPVYVPYPDSSRLDNLARDFGQVGGKVDTLTQSLDTLKLRVDSTVHGIDSAMDQKVQPLGVRLLSVGDELAYTKSEVQALKDQAATLRLDFLKKVDLLNASVEDLRSDYRNQFRPPANRGFIAKILKPGDERYLVTFQSVLVLTQLMCRKAQIPQDPQTDLDRTYCAVNAPCYCQNNKLFIDRLTRMIGDAPMTETKLSEALSAVDAAAWKAWKGVILRYTRVV